jgi:hypothetical protein
MEGFHSFCLATAIYFICYPFPLVMPVPPCSHSHSQLSPSLVGVTRPSKSSEFAASVSFFQSNVTCSPSFPLMGWREQLWVAHIWGNFS